MTVTDPGHALAEAARRALRAPSILNTQPWRWRVRDGALELFADRTRQLSSIDHDGRLLTLSCGAALHHARVALSATGYDATVERFPDPDDPDLLGRLSLVDGREPHEGDIQALDSMRRRHTERRPFAATVPVPGPAIALLRKVAEQEGAWLYPVPPEQVPSLAAAVETAATAEAEREDYRADLARWTSRDRSSGNGVPAEAVTAQVALPVHLRDFSSHETLLDPGFGDDRFAAFLILATAGDTRSDWLRAGEATSAVWLAATAADLVVSVLSDAIEIPPARAQLRRLLPTPGHPQLVFRVGVDMQPQPPPRSPRRPSSDVIE
jgi:hypothetical protein